MTLLIILALVFLSVAIMVVLGEKFGKPLDQPTQQKYSKILIVLVFASLFIAILKNAFG
ncbi:hypothetical protein [Thalassotalea euphylliae]|uniref:hypothetical protein n=1 Tax=Thalassotalea euphylliae TaxID=1655234 RepID=UPI0015F25C41|nr:hypothetical protein [Thalassotalea euphylliae]